MPNSDRPKPATKATTPPAVVLTDCPNCGRKGVAVFPVLRPDKPDDTAQLVCPHCCPDAHNRS